MPCPDAQFNSVKGCTDDVKDYFPLMIDKIQKCIDKKIPLIYGNNHKEKINLQTLEKWHEWFVVNREKYSFELYYKVKQDDNKIIGTPLFKNQSLDYPCPKTESEVKECLAEIIKRIKYRAKLILEKA